MKQRIILIFTILLLLNGCKNDETKEDEALNGGTIYTSQMVTLEASNISQDEYTATLNDTEIVINKLSDSKVFFYVPVNIELGAVVLRIPDLNNKKILYEIEKTILSQTVEETLAPYFVNITNLKNQLSQDSSGTGSLNVNQAIELFEHELQNASEADKQLFAEFYAANKELFDAVYQTDYTNPLAKDYSNLGDDEAFNNLAKAVPRSILVSAAAFAVIEVPFVNVAAAALAVTSWYNTYDLFYEVKNRKLFKVDFVIDNISSSIAGNDYETIIYSHNLIDEDLVIMKAKSIDNSYIDSSIETISNFFNGNRLFNNAVTKINKVIIFINDHVLFSDMQTLDLATVDGETQVGDVVINGEVYENMTFSVVSTNVSIDQMNYEDGKLKTKLSIIDLDAVTDNYLETTLNFHYKNSFNDIQGSFPIRINIEDELDLEGTWNTTYLTNECTNIISTFFNNRELIFEPTNSITGNVNIDSFLNANQNESYTENTYNYNEDTETLTISIKTSLLPSGGDTGVREFSFEGEYDSENNKFEGNFTYYQKFDGFPSNLTKNCNGTISIYKL